MACSICGKEGHNSRSCPSKDIECEDSERDMAAWFKFDNITKDESSQLIKGIIDLKDRVAPNARGTFARDKKQNLPSEIRKALNLTGKENE